MSFSINDYGLSALNPVRFIYDDVNDTSKFIGEYKPIRDNFLYFDHKAFQNYKDAALSKKSCLVLTNDQPLESFFDPRFTSEVIYLGKLSGSFYLRLKNKFLTEKNKQIYLGSTCGGEPRLPILITLSPVEGGFVELRVGNKFLEIDSDYPFTVKLVDSQTFGDIKYRRFEADYSNKKIAFKIKTNEGYRFLSTGIDNVLRAVGLELNDTIVNDYHFTVVSEMRSALNKGIVIANAETNHVQYYSSFDEQEYNKTLDIKLSDTRYQNFLVSCPTLKISTSEQPIANIANLKTNYSTLGTYLK